MPDRRVTWRTLALLAASATAVAACSSSSSSSKSTDSGAAGGSSGGGGKCPAGITIGFFGALTGESANLGINEYNGMKLAISQFNKANPTCVVKETHYDSEGSPDKAPAQAQQAIKDTNTVALIGPAFSGESKAADPLFNEAGLPTVTASATNPKLSTNGWKIFHRAVGNDAAQGPAAAGYITGDLKAKKVAVIDDGSEYGKGVADIVRAKVTAAGATVTSDQLDPKASDFSSSVNKIKGAGAEAVFFGGYYQAAGLLVKQLRDAGVQAKFVAPDGSEDPGFVTAAGQAAAEGAVLTAPAAPIEKVTGGQDFITAYKAAAGQDVGLYSVESFDSANAVLDAIKNGATTRKAINDYLNTKTDWKGLSKTLKWDDKGELAGQVTIYAYTVQGGKIVGLQALKG
ncbi:MAG: branched-chain amino acid ABC transporter substrate-binding protein [Acidimicrobiales bacterium]